jgi:hypothetical protein
VKELPQYHTLNYDLDLEFLNGRKIHVSNTGVNAGPADLFFEVGTPMIAASDNPFERVMMKKLTGTITVTPEAREAQILNVNVPRLKFRPGETVKGYMRTARSAPEKRSCRSPSTSREICPTANTNSASRTGSGI